MQTPPDNSPETTVRTTGVITASAYRSMVEFRVKKRKSSGKAQTITDQTTNRLFYIMVLFPGGFFLVGYFAFHMSLLSAGIIALFWFLSFVLAGLLYHRSVVGIATRRPSSPHLDQPRDYALEGEWLVVRTADTENRTSLKRAVELVVTPAVSFLDCGELGPFLLPFGSDSQQPGQREFLEVLQKRIPKPELA